MFVGRPIAQVMNVEFHDSLFLCAFHDALAQRPAADFREQRDDVDPHSLHVSAATPKPKIYPPTGWRVTSDELQAKTFCNFCKKSIGTGESFLNFFSFFLKLRPTNPEVDGEE